MGFLIDSSVLIEHERGRLDVREHLLGREDEEFFLSVITASELLHGVHRASEPAVRARRAAWVEAVLDRFPLLEIDVTVARSHARIWSDLRAEGRLIGAHDLWIAATCLSHGLDLITTNERGFERVPGLTVIDWQRT